MQHVLIADRYRELSELGWKELLVTAELLGKAGDTSRLAGGMLPPC